MILPAFSPSYPRAALLSPTSGALRGSESVLQRRAVINTVSLTGAGRQQQLRRIGNLHYG